MVEMQMRVDEDIDLGGVAADRLEPRADLVAGMVVELEPFADAGAGIPDDGYFLRDGSGLARLNLVTPASVVKLLRHMYASPLREQWMSLLPVGGQDGTLGARFINTSAAGRVHAKTGSLSHVSALSGYIQRVNGSWAAFSILVNNYNTRTAEVRGAIDRICTLIVDERSVK